MAYSGAGAKELATQALLFLSERPDMISGFLGSSGMRPEDLRQSVGSASFCISVLDFLLEDDRRVLDFAQNNGIRPEEVLTARTALAGPGSFGWEAE